MQYTTVAKQRKLNFDGLLYKDGEYHRKQGVAFPTYNDALCNSIIICR